MTPDSQTSLKALPQPFSRPGDSARTLVMGVVNVTPDSFSDGGVHLDPDVAIAAAIRMLDDGADIIDVGGESTRPGSEEIPISVEIERTMPVISGIRSLRPEAIISIDTRRRPVAEAAISSGAVIINDVAGFRDDPGLVDLARESEAGLVVMHMLGRPKTMQADIHYNSFPGDIFEFFQERIQTLESAGIDPSKIVIDPGIGFGKTFDQNLTLLNRLDFFLPLKKPLLVGSSRKAFIGKILDLPEPASRDVGTMATVAAAVLRGASIVRVHDVASAVHVCRVTDAILRERVAL
ncbi:MAG: dihydropteroate synthase [Thermodesulfobacteriota bacterium]